MTSDLKDRRRSAGLTQRELADRLGIAQSNVSSYEKGTRPISAVMKARIVDATAVRPSIRLEQHQTEIVRQGRVHGLTFLAVFGSCLEGLDTPESDIDLLYDYVPGTSLFGIAEFANNVEELTEASIDLTSVRSAWGKRQMPGAVVLFDDRTQP